MKASTMVGGGGGGDGGVEGEGGRKGAATGRPEVVKEVEG